MSKPTQKEIINTLKKTMRLLDDIQRNIPNKIILDYHDNVKEYKEVYAEAKNILQHFDDEDDWVFEQKVEFPKPPQVLPQEMVQYVLQKNHILWLNLDNICRQLEPIYHSKNKKIRGRVATCRRRFYSSGLVEYKKNKKGKVVRPIQARWVGDRDKKLRRDLKNDFGIDVNLLN